jgi:putative selenium metabolism hydrolase
MSDGSKSTNAGVPQQREGWNEPIPYVVELARQLVQVGARSGQEKPVALLIEKAMCDLGYRNITRDRLGNVVGFVGPEGSPTSLLFDGHMDVVEVTGQWTVEPFAGVIRNGRLFGRGTTDMKGPLAAVICGVAQAAQTGGLKRPVAVSASVLEETIEGGALGEVLDRISPEMVVICEPSSLSIKTGQRGRIEIIMDVLGIPAHAAHPERGRNALVLAAEAIQAVGKMALPSDTVLGQAIMVPTDIISHPYPLISALPESVTIRFDRRIIVGETRESVLGELHRRLAEIDSEAFKLRISTDPVSTYTGETVRWERFLAAWKFDRDIPLARAAAASLAKANVAVQFGYYAFCTNGSESAGERNIPTIGLGPGAEGDAHTADESISLDELLKAVETYRNLAINIAGAPK